MSGISKPNLLMIQPTLLNLLAVRQSMNFWDFSLKKIIIIIIFGTSPDDVTFFALLKD